MSDLVSKYKKQMGKIPEQSEKAPKDDMPFLSGLLFGGKNQMNPFQWQSDTHPASPARSTSVSQRAMEDEQRVLITREFSDEIPSIFSGMLARDAPPYITRDLNADEIVCRSISTGSERGTTVARLDQDGITIDGIRLTAEMILGLVHILREQGAPKLTGTEVVRLKEMLGSQRVPSLTDEEITRIREMLGTV